jgi:hypothetical protein
MPWDDIDLEALRVPLTSAPPKPRRERQSEPFTQVPNARAIAIGSGAKNFTLLMWLFLAHEAWTKRTDTVEVSNQAVGKWGIGRSAKARALHWLEAQGHITVERRGKRCPAVTLLR